eukprot:3970145-Pyramimonas_sp.AAC.1
MQAGMQGGMQGGVGSAGGGFGERGGGSSMLLESVESDRIFGESQSDRILFGESHAGVFAT